MIITTAIIKKKTSTSTSYGEIHGLVLFKERLVLLWRECKSYMEYVEKEDVHMVKE